MRWFKNVLAAIASVNLVVSPVLAINKNKPAPSQPTQTKQIVTRGDVFYNHPQGSQINSGSISIGGQPTARWNMINDKMAQYRDFLEPLGYKINFDSNSKKALVYDKNTNDLVMEIPFSSEGELRKYSPNSLNKQLLDEMVRFKKAAGSSAKASWSHSVQNIRPESLVFFVAMGAVVAGQLIMNYSQNPVAMKHHIDHSMSPIGIFGFFAFMYSQGLTSNLLAMYMKNPRFHHMIPYLGMTVGAFTQSYLSQIASDPNVKACAKQMLGQQSSEDQALMALEGNNACEMAYDYLVIHKKLWEFAPGITSMLISSGLAGYAQSAVTKGVLRLTGVDISLWLIPGSMQVKGIRLWLTKGLQIATFVAIDAWLSRKVAYNWKNFFEGFSFFDTARDLSDQINKMKQSKWEAPDNELQYQLKEFHSHMTNWRMMNLADVYEAHQNWAEKLKQLTGMYKSSHSFYESFINEIKTARFTDSRLKLLERTYPFNGIIAQDLSNEKKDFYLTNPNFIESMQIDRMVTAVNRADFISRWEGNQLLPKEKVKVESIIKKIRSENRDQVVSAIFDLLKEIDYTLHNFNVSDSYKKILRDLYITIGQPRPMMEPGRGYLEAYEKSPSTKDSFEGVSFYKQVGRVQTLKFTDYMIMQMICGPDAGKYSTSNVKNSEGYPSVFLPPRIGNPNDTFDICENGVPTPADEIYRHPFKSSSGKTSTGAISYLLNEARPILLNDQSEETGKSPFEKWWHSVIDSQMITAFEKYSKSYDEIVVKMIKSIFGSSHYPLNSGPISNGALDAIFQEERTYLSMLEELLTPSQKYALDLRWNLQKRPSHPVLKSVEDQFAAMKELLETIKITTEDGHEVIKSSLENYELLEQLEKIKAELNTVAKLLGVDDDCKKIFGDSKDDSAKKAEPSAEANSNGSKSSQMPATKEVIKLNPQQTNLAVDSLENLKSIATEMMMYGSIANAVSWDKIQNLKKLDMVTQKTNNDIQKLFLQMRGQKGNGMMMNGDAQ